MSFVCPLQKSSSCNFHLTHLPLVLSDHFHKKKLLHVGVNLVYCSKACLKSR